MKDYQPQKNNDNWIPHNKYMQTLYFIRSYYELKEEHDAILSESSAPSDGQPRGTNVGDPTAQKAARAEEIYNDILIIERAKRNIPERFRQCIWDNVMNHSGWISEYSESMLRKEKGKFIREIAKAKKII